MHQAVPKGQIVLAYDTAVKGTQMTMKSRSATARLMISVLVVLRICRLATTTMITDRLPTKPRIAMTLNTTGTTTRTTASYASILAVRSSETLLVAFSHSATVVTAAAAVVVIVSLKQRNQQPQLS